MTSLWWKNSSSWISRMSKSFDSALKLPYPMILLSVLLLPTTIPCPFGIYLNTSLVYFSSFSLLIIFHYFIPIGIGVWDSWSRVCSSTFCSKPMEGWLWTRTSHERGQGNAKNQLHAQQDFAWG